MPNADMVDYWNGRPADFWVKEAEHFDTMLAPFGRRLLTAAALEPGEVVLDVGCGNGAISLEAARSVGPGGRVTGLDLSSPMLGMARRRAEELTIDVDFVHGDAQTDSFDQPFDVVVSRFGVMFFDDPEVAFANLAMAARPGGRLCFVCWQEMFANEWITVPAMAIVAHVGMPEVPEPGTRGPFALADTQRTRGLLESAGWSRSPSRRTRPGCSWDATPKTSSPSCFLMRSDAGWWRARTPRRCRPGPRPPSKRCDRTRRPRVSCWAAHAGS